MGLVTTSTAAPGAPVSGQEAAPQQRPDAANGSTSGGSSDAGAFGEALSSAAGASAGANPGADTRPAGSSESLPDASGKAWGADFKDGFMSAVQSNPALQAHIAELDGQLGDWQNSLAFDAGAAAGTLEFLAGATMKDVLSNPLAQPTLDEMRQEAAFFKQVFNAPELVSYIQSHPREAGAALGLLYRQSVETIATSAPTAFGKGMAYGRMMGEGVYVMSQLALGVVMTARMAPATVQAIKANGLFQRLFSIVRGPERAFPALPMPSIHVTAEVIGAGGKPMAAAAPRQLAAGAPAPKMLPAAAEPKLLPAAPAETLAAEAEQTALAGRRFNPDESGIFRIGPDGPVPIERALPGDGTYGPLAPVGPVWTGPRMSTPAAPMSIVASVSGNGGKPGNGDKPKQPLEPGGIPPQQTAGGGDPGMRPSHTEPAPEPEATPNPPSKMGEIANQFIREPDNLELDNNNTYRLIRGLLISSIEARMKIEVGQFSSAEDVLKAIELSSKPYNKLRLEVGRLFEEGQYMPPATAKLYYENLDSMLSDLEPRVEAIAKNNISAGPILTYMQDVKDAVKAALEAIYDELARRNSDPRLN